MSSVVFTISLRHKKPNRRRSSLLEKSGNPEKKVNLEAPSEGGLAKFATNNHISLGLASVSTRENPNTKSFPASQMHCHHPADFKIRGEENLMI